MKLAYAIMLVISATNVAFAAPAPTPEIGGGFVGMAAVAGLVYIIQRRKQR